MSPGPNDAAQSGTARACADEVNDILLARYLDVLDIAELTRLTRDEKEGRLSGLFLPAVSDDYLQSDVRVMLIGQETRGWGQRLSSLAASEQTPETLPTYVRAQMAVHQRFSKTRPGTSKFRQFHSRLHASLGTRVATSHNAVFWGNLLCLSLNGGSPRKASDIESIAAISYKLLSIQFEVLKPQLVVFATGHGYDPFLKQHIGSYTTLAGFEPRHYWPFEAHGPGFKGWRVRHPRRLTRDVKQKLLRDVRACAGAQ